MQSNVLGHPHITPTGHAWSSHHSVSVLMLMQWRFRISSVTLAIFTRSALNTNSTLWSATLWLRSFHFAVISLTVDCGISKRVGSFVKALSCYSSELFKTTHSFTNIYKGKLHGSGPDCGTGTDNTEIQRWTGVDRYFWTLMYVILM